MRIAELILENTQVDELSLKGIGQGLSKAANTVGGAIGGAQGQWRGMKNVYAQKRDRMAAVAQRNAERAGGYKKPAVPPAQGAPLNPSSISATSGGTGTPYVNTGVSDAPAASGGAVGGIMQAIDKLDPASKKQLAGELEKNISGAPAATAPDELAAVKKNAGLPPTAPATSTTPPAVAPSTGTPTAAPEPAAKAPAPNFGSGQQANPAPTKINYSGMAAKAPIKLPQATTGTGAYSVKNAYAQPGPSQAEIDADRERAMGPDNGGANEGKVFRSKFLGIDL